ncbi:MAG: BrnA antitoxin family protein [Peptostreptococcaceae bacterium]|nr:BrnA antitoxin family protein [Peptostreptococcaceae bacterium]
MRKEEESRKSLYRKDPYGRKRKKKITINIDADTIDFFKERSEKEGIPYQTLINFYLSECAAKKKLQTS